MSNVRREKTRQKFGFDTEKDISKKEKVKQVARAHREVEVDRRKEIEENGLYKTLMKGALGFDVADGLMGFLELGGDILSAVLALAYVVLSLFVVKSLRLTMAVFIIVVVDLAIGMVPMAGTLLDVVFCGNYINRTLIKGFVEGDKSAKRKVNLISSIGFFVIFLAIAFWLSFIFLAGDKVVDIIHSDR